MRPIQIAEDIVHSLQIRLNEYEELANDLVPYIQSGEELPLVIKQRYEAIGNIAEGLQEAIDIIKQSDYMLEDVDLSGGEDID